MKRFIIKLRSNILVLLTHTIALPILKIVRKKKKFPYSMEQLSALPFETVGNELWQLLNAENLRLLPYYERHDIKHVVLDYPFTDEGEVSLQFFMLANGRVSFPVLATVLYGLMTMPEYYSSFRRAYQRGKEANDLSSIDWFTIMQQPLVEVRHQYSLTK